jgi:hypothetical protein
MVGTIKNKRKTQETLKLRNLKLEFYEFYHIVERTENNGLFMAIANPTLAWKN